jgi:hypothetical protein
MSIKNLITPTGTYNLYAEQGNFAIPTNQLVLGADGGNSLTINSVQPTSNLTYNILDNGVNSNLATVTTTALQSVKQPTFDIASISISYTIVNGSGTILTSNAYKIRCGNISQYYIAFTVNPATTTGGTLGIQFGGGIPTTTNSIISGGSTINVIDGSAAQVTLAGSKIITAGSGGNNVTMYIYPATAITGGSVTVSVVMMF